MIGALRQYLEAFNFFFEKSAIEWGEDGDRQKMTSTEIVFPGGSKITALPASPCGIRGFSANVFLDEFAFHVQSAKIWRAVFPVISRGWKCRIVSTPNGKGNKFYELMTQRDSVWSRHVCDIHQAIAEGLPYDAEELRKALCDEDAWRQEYLLEWLDEASSWISFDLINAVEDEGAGHPETRSGGQVFIGNDIARRSHLWVAWVIEKVGDVFWTREIRTLKGATFAEQDAVFDELIARYQPVRVSMDRTGIGEKPVEDAQHRHGSRIEGVVFNVQTKQVLADLVKRAFEDRKIRIPMGDDVLRRDLHKVRCVPSPTGMPRFDASADGEGHADRFWALALACHAAACARPIDLGAICSSGSPRASTAMGSFSAEPIGRRVLLEGFSWPIKAPQTPPERPSPTSWRRPPTAATSPRAMLNSSTI